MLHAKCLLAYYSDILGVLRYSWCWSVFKGFDSLRRDNFDSIRAENKVDIGVLSWLYLCLFVPGRGFHHSAVCFGTDQVYIIKYISNHQNVFSLHFHLNPDVCHLPRSQSRDPSKVNMDVDFS